MVIGLGGLLAALALMIGNPSSASVPQRACLGDHCSAESVKVAPAEDDARPSPSTCLHQEACGGAAVLAGSVLSLAVILAAPPPVAALAWRVRRAPPRLQLHPGTTGSLFRPPRLAA